MSGLLEKDICLLLKGHRNTMILFLSAPSGARF